MIISACKETRDTKTACIEHATLNLANAALVKWTFCKESFQTGAAS